MTRPRRRRPNQPVGAVVLRMTAVADRDRAWNMLGASAVVGGGDAGWLSAARLVGVGARVLPKHPIRLDEVKGGRGFVSLLCIRCIRCRCKETGPPGNATQRIARQEP